MGKRSPGSNSTTNDQRPTTRRAHPRDPYRDQSREASHLVRRTHRLVRRTDLARRFISVHRKYRPWHYRAKIEKIRAAMPGAAIGADVMVGFPGETDAEFEATRKMIEELPFTY